MLLQLGLLEDAYNIYNKLSAYAKKHKYLIGHFICEYNLSKLGIILRRNYFKENRDKLIKRCNSIDLNKVIYSLHDQGLSREIITLFRWISRGDFITTTTYDTSNTIKNLRKNYSLDQRGGRSSNGFYQDLLDQTATLVSFTEGNFLIYNHFSDFRKIINNSIEGIVALNEIKNEASTQIIKVGDYYLKLWIFYSDPSYLEEIFKNYGVTKLKYILQSHPIFPNIIKVVSNLNNSTNTLNKFVSKDNYILFEKLNRYFQNMVVLQM